MVFRTFEPLVLRAGPGRSGPRHHRRPGRQPPLTRGACSATSWPAGFASRSRPASAARRAQAARASSACPPSIFAQAPRRSRRSDRSGAAEALQPIPRTASRCWKPPWRWLEAGPARRDASSRWATPPIRRRCSTSRTRRCCSTSWAGSRRRRAAIAIVGSRNPTPQGLENARVRAQPSPQAGVTVVSGLALGIDGAAHEGALEGAAPAGGDDRRRRHRAGPRLPAAAPAAGAPHRRAA